MPLGTATEERGDVAGRIDSATQMRELLDELLRVVDSDPELGPRLRSVGITYRYVFTDLDLSLIIAGSEEGTHNLRWSFSDQPEWMPSLTLAMTADVANRYLQGRENLAIAMARGEIRCSCKARAALELLPISPALSERYRRVLKRRAPHLLLR